MKLNGKGFTMVELLVVLLIIGVLAAIATPLYLANTNRAKASEAVATMGMIRQAEREYYTKNAPNYLTVTSPNLKNDPGATTNPGLGIDVGIPQYFSNECYYVTVGATDGAFTNPSAVNFIIYVDGSKSIAATSTGGAIKNTDVANYKLMMDNTGRVKVLYSGTTYTDY